MDEFFTTQHVGHTFKVSHQTVKNWCEEFAVYLSPTARPEPGRKRMFTPGDMQVFALVAEYHKRGFRYDDAHMALRSGQRGQPPASDADLTPTVPPALLVQLREELKNRDVVIQALTAEREQEKGKVQILTQQLADKERRIEELFVELARLKAKYEG